jgi:CRP/FNR family transcriptional regulator
LIGAGATIGLEAIMGHHYNHLAQTLTDAEICRLPVQSIKQLSKEQPELCEKLILQWQEQMERADAHLVKLSTGTIKQRVLNLLQLMAELCKTGEIPFLLPSNQDCAALVDARVESVSRVIAECKRNGILQKDADGHWQVCVASASASLAIVDSR